MDLKHVLSFSYQGGPINIRDHEYLLAIAEEKNIRKAAEKCHITPSALTQKIKAIEAEIGAELFVRTNAGCFPTENGDIFLRSAKEILTIHRAAIQQIRDNSNDPTGTLNVGLPPDRGADMFMYIYPRFHSRYPQMSIKLVETDTRKLQELVADGKLDLAIIGALDDQKINNRYISIRKEEMLVLIPRIWVEQEMISTDEPYFDLCQLRSQPFALVSKESTMRQWQEQIFAGYGFTPKVVFETSRASTIDQMVSLGLCCSIISDHYYHPSLMGIYYSRISRPSVWDIFATYNSNGYLSDASRYFVALARGFLEHLPKMDGSEKEPGAGECVIG